MGYVGPSVAGIDFRSVVLVYKNKQLSILVLGEINDQLCQFCYHISLYSPRNPYIILRIDEATYLFRPLSILTLLMIRIIFTSYIRMPSLLREISIEQKVCIYEDIIQCNYTTVRGAKL